MGNILTVNQVIENAETLLDFKQRLFLLNAKNSQSEIEKFLEVIGLHPCDLGFPKGKDMWSSEKEDAFFSRILTSILPYEGEIEVDYEYLLSVYKDVFLCFENSEDDEDDEDEEAKWYLVTDEYGDYQGEFTPEDFEEMLREDFEKMFGEAEKPECRFRCVEDEKGRDVAEMYNENTGEPLLRQRWKKKKG